MKLKSVQTAVLVYLMVVLLFTFGCGGGAEPPRLLPEGHLLNPGKKDFFNCTYDATTVTCVKTSTKDLPAEETVSESTTEETPENDQIQTRD